jgi:hypothetical protein
VIPVARNVWQPISAAMPAAAARRPIIRQASGWLIGLPESAPLLCPRAVRNSQPLRSSTMLEIDVGAQCLSERVMARYAVLLAAFLMQSDRPSGAARPQVLNLHLEGRTDARAAVSEGGDKRPISEIAQRRDRDGVKQLTPFLAL